MAERSGFAPFSMFELSRYGVIVFGVGMALSGYCPGTCAAGAGEGKMDYIVPGVLGFLTGAVIFGLTYPTSGHVQVLDHRVAAADEQLRPVGAQPQQPQSPLVGDGAQLERQAGGGGHLCNCEIM